MIFFHKILPLFIMPIVVAVFLIVLGLYKNKKFYIYFSIIQLYVLSTPIFSYKFLRLVEDNQRRKSIVNIEHANAIVVLSGMLSVHEFDSKEYIEWNDPDRFFEGVALMKAGKAPNLIFTGAQMPWRKSGRTEGAVLADYAVECGISDGQILVSSKVTNTKDEAIAIKKMALGSKIILVTSAFHMTRAQTLFEKEGFEVISYPVDFKSLADDSVTFMDYIPSGQSLAKTEIGMRELIGRLYYWLQFRLSNSIP